MRIGKPLFYNTPPNTSCSDNGCRVENIVETFSLSRFGGLRQNTVRHNAHWNLVPWDAHCGMPSFPPFPNPATQSEGVVSYPFTGETIIGVPGVGVFAGKAVVGTSFPGFTTPNGTSQLRGSVQIN